MFSTDVGYFIHWKYLTVRLVPRCLKTRLPSALCKDFSVLCIRILRRTCGLSAFVVLFELYRLGEVRLLTSDRAPYTLDWSRSALSLVQEKEELFLFVVNLSLFSTARVSTI